MKILLLGLGRANLAVAEYLLQRDDEVFLYEENLEALQETAKNLIKNNLVKMFEEINYDLVVSSPGFPPNKEIIKKMKSKRIAVIDEIEFTYQQLFNPKIIAVTGTNGKSTTTALISSILSSADIKNFLGGNIAPGRPFSVSLFKEKYKYYVLEVSSFQLMRIKKFHPVIAVLTNIDIDHLNWHKDINEYIDAKAKIFINQDKSDFAVLNLEDEKTNLFVKKIRSQIVYFGRMAKDGVWLNKNFHYKKERLLSTTNLPLVGEHNLQNIMAAIAVAKILNITDKDIEKGIRNFKPLPHRLEDLGIINGVRYINNSMCTNERAAIVSFKAVTGNRIVIVGGSAKGKRGDKYLDLLVKEAKACVILGENAYVLAEYFKAKGFNKFVVSKDMADAVKRCREFAERGDTIMLNPGFASFGLFRDFLERGEAFRNVAHRN